MTILVPFDGSTLSIAALRRATALSRSVDADVTTVTVVPGGRAYAAGRGWIDAGEPLQRDVVEERVRDQVEAVTPDATVRFEHEGQRPSTGVIARRLRDVARDVDPSLVVLGSENAGKTSQPVRSVSGAFTNRTDYDLYLVRSAEAPTISG